MILLDTNVVSELLRPQPNPTVLAFLQASPAAELRYSYMRLPLGRRRDLEARLDKALRTSFRGRVLPFDQACAAGYALARAARERIGRPIAVTDALIGSMALAHGAMLATRNVADFDGYGLIVVSPWQHT